MSLCGCVGWFGVYLRERERGGGGAGEGGEGGEGGEVKREGGGKERQNRYRYRQME